MISKTGLVFVLLAALLVMGCTDSAPSSGNGTVRTAPVLISTQNSVQGSINATNGGLAMSGVVKNGDSVKVDYLGTTEGKVFDTSIEVEAKKAGLPPRPTYEPLPFIVGAHQVVPGFENAVLGMKIGEEKTAVLAPKEAYGEKDPRAVVQVPRTLFANGSEPKIGLPVQSPQGYPGVIVNVSKDNVTVDFNSPLAGKTLTFKIILREIVKK